MVWLEPITLQGPYARLEPLSRDHHDGLTEAVKDGELWKLWYTFVPRPEDMRKEIDRRLKVIDQIVRHMIGRVDEEKKVVDRIRTKRQTESERRRVKRGLPPQRQPGEGRSADNDDNDDDRFDGAEV